MPVAVVPLPDGAIQPQAVVDANDVIHMIFFSGKPAGVDIYYVKLAADGRRLSQPVRVNSIEELSIKLCAWFVRQNHDGFREMIEPCEPFPAA